MNTLSILTLNAGLLEIDVPLLRTITLVKDKNIRVHAIIDMLKKSTHDVVLMQEIGGSLLKKIVKNISDVFPYQATHHAWRLFSNNLLILSKLPLKNIKFIPFKLQTHFESWGIQKGMMCADVTSGDTTYHLINTHLVASGTSSGDGSPKTLRVRHAQINQMKEHINSTYSTDDIVIVGGDFNSGPLTCRENYDVIVDELYDVMQHVDEAERITWNPTNPLVRKSTKSDPHKQLDGFYMHHHHYEHLKGGLNICRTFMEEVEVTYGKKTHKVMLSDHYGVEMRISHNKNTY